MMLSHMVIQVFGWVEDFVAHYTSNSLIFTAQIVTRNIIIRSRGRGHFRMGAFRGGGFLSGHIFREPSVVNNSSFLSISKTKAEVGLAERWDLAKLELSSSGSKSHSSSVSTGRNQNFVHPWWNYSTVSAPSLLSQTKESEVNIPP